jgi:hypothetical protein
MRGGVRRYGVWCRSDYATTGNATGMRSVREHQQPRVKDNRVEDMASNLNGQREDSSPSTRVDAPGNGDEIGAEDDHAHHEGPADEVGSPEALEDTWDFHEEVADLDFLDRSTPGDVVRGQMSQDGTRQVKRHSTEEEDKERQPLHVEEDRADKT